MSLLFSIVYFNNPFTIYHWVGTTLVFIGTLIFTEVISVTQKVAVNGVPVPAAGAVKDKKKE